MVFILMLSVIAVSAQDGEQSGMIKSAKGVLVVWNEPGNYFTIEVVGNSIKPAGEPPPILFQVDGMFLQIQTTETEPFLKDSKIKNPDDKTILSAHRDWEANYSEGIFGSKVKVDSEWIKLPNGSDALAWGFDIPKKFIADNKSSATRQLFLTVVKRGRVFVLNSAVEANNDEKKLRKLMGDTLNTMKSSDKPLSLKAAAEQVLKEK